MRGFAKALLGLAAAGASMGAPAQVVSIRPVPSVEASANVSYVGDTNSAFSTDGIPGSALATAAVGPGGSAFSLPVIGPVNDESSATARALVPGTVGSRSIAGGFSPSAGPGGATEASSFARQVTDWQVVSNDASVTTADIDVLAFFDGTLATLDFAGAPMSASVHAEMNVYSAAGMMNVFTADATLSDPLGLSGSANWIGDFSYSAPSFAAQVATVNYNDFFEDAFTVTVGETFAWEVILSTTATVAGPFEILAGADFLNTGSGGLSVNSPGLTLVQVSAVPEPPIWLAMLLGLPLLYRRRISGA
ncbi:MAG: hypothetical protein KDH20_21480 [Rhodocyclaceae bacterium]|nr:hypothetical protein [Rhodocyclaceae bacterium]